jgi:hypothetical protein
MEGHTVVPIGVKATSCKALYCRDVPSTCSLFALRRIYGIPTSLICVHRGGERLGAKRHGHVGRIAEIAPPDDQRQWTMVAEDPGVMAIS